MLKYLAIFVVLVIAQAPATTSPLKSEATPLRTPEQRIAKDSSSENRQNQSTPHQNNQTTPKLIPVHVLTAAPVCDEACQQARENLKIQGKLELFTGGLVLVGFLQVGTMIWQAWLLRQTRNDVHTQAGQMQRQTEILDKSVAAAQKGADAAEISAIASKISAEAAKENIEAFENKERARIRIEISDLWLASGLFNRPLKLTIFHHGSTEAFVSNHGVSLQLTDSEIAPETAGIEVSMDKLPPVIEPKTPPIEIGPNFLSFFNDSEIAEVKNGTKFAHLYGFIEFTDTFEKPHRVSFRKRWYVTNVKNFSGGGFNEFFSVWVDCRKATDAPDY
jgi:hypothetical protein